MVEETPESVDREALDLGPMVRYARTATFAPNWKSVLAADGAIGLVIVALGILAWQWIPLLGAAVIATGVVYVFLVIRRFLQWRWLRAKAGLT